MTDVRDLERQLERAHLELEQTRAMLAQLRRRRERSGGRPNRPLQPGRDHLVQATYRIEGPAQQVATLDFFLRHVSTACEAGSTAFYQLMVDGDGAASLTIERDGQRVGVTEAEEDWLFGEGERPEGMPDAVLRDEEVLELEIV